MSFSTGYSVKFLLLSFASNKDKKWVYWLGLLFTLAVSMLLMLSRSLKKKLLVSKSPKWKVITLELLIKVFAAMEMLLLMTFNYGVVFTIVGGSAIGYALGTTLFVEKKKCDEGCEREGQVNSDTFKSKTPNIASQYQSAQMQN